jgi:Na+-driven multidrug efflux pump
MLRIMRMKETVTLNRKTVRLTKRIVEQIIRIGLPGGLQMMIMSMSFMLVQSLVNAVQIPFNGVFDGAVFVAVNTAVMRLDHFAMMPSQTFNMTASTFTAQNIGAGKTDRVMQGFRIIMTMALGISAVIIVGMLAFSPQLIGMFINDPNPARTALITDLGIRMIRIIVVAYLLMAASHTIGGVLRGAGDTMAQLFITVGTNVAFRMPFTIFMVNATKSAEYPGGRPETIFYSMIIAFSINLLVNSIYFSRGRWKTKSIIKHKRFETAAASAESA